MKTEFNINQIPETKFGGDAVPVLFDGLKEMGSEKPLLIIDGYMRKTGLTDHITASLVEKYPESCIFESQSKILSDDEIIRALGQIATRNIDSVIGYGGWRCTDLAKILALGKSNPDLEMKVRSGSLDQIQRGLPVISIPSTPPNGAEIDNKVIFRQTEKKNLIAFEHIFFAPRLTIVDPQIMVTLPPDLTASTGLDALSHAIEALISINASPFSEIMALQSIALLKENIVDAFKNGTNLRARYNVAWGSLLSALALNTTGSGMIHALAYPLTALHIITHPQATALVTLAVMKFNLPVIPAQFVRVARLLGCNVQGNESDAIKALEALESIYRNLEQPMHLSSYNISGNDIESLADMALKFTGCLSRNPRHVERDDIIAIYRNSY